MIETKTEIANLHSGKAISRNAVINLAGQILPLLAGIVSIPLLIKGLGTDRFGVLTLAWMVIGYFSLFDLGLGRALTQIISKRLGKVDATELSCLVWTALIIMLIMGMVGAFIAGCSSPFLVSNVFNMPDQLRNESLYSFLILSLSIPVVIISSALVGILTAYQRFDLITSVRVPLGVSNFVAPLLVLQFSHSLVPSTVLLALCRFFSCVVQYYMCLRVMPALRTEARFMPETIKPLLRFGGWMTVSNVISPLMVYLDRFVIGAIVSVSAVAYYATPYELVTKLLIIPGALVATLFPAFANAHDHDPDRTLSILSKGLTVTFIIFFPMALFFVTFANEGLTVWLGPVFAKNSSVVLQILTLGVFINGLAQIVFALVQGAGRSDLTAKLHLLELVFYLPVLWWALKCFGIVGAAIAWTLRTAFDGGLLLWCTKRLFTECQGIPIKTALSVFVASVAMLCCGLPKALFLRASEFSLLAVIYLLFVTNYLWRKGLRHSNSR